MSRYQPLTDRLSAHPDPEWRASYAEIEGLLGFPLPKAARAGAAWWTRQGFTARADTKSGEVVFRRGEVSPAAMQAVLGAPESEPKPQPPVLEVPDEPMRLAPTRKGWGLIAAAAGGVAVLAGIGVAVARGKRRA